MSEVKPLVSAIVPVFNGGTRLSNALKSIADQSYSRIEIIVVDDGSTDNCRETANRFQPLKYIYQNHRGVSAARNAGIQASQGQLVAFLDHDDVWYEHKTMRQVELMVENQKLGLTWTKSKISVEQGTPLPDWCTPEVLQRDSIMLPSSWVVRAEVFQEGLLFNESLSSHEDIDWLARFSAKKIERKMLPEVLLERRLHTENLSFRYDDRSELLKVLKMNIDRQRSDR